MAEWVYEDGIGEARAALIVDDAIVEAFVELPGLRAGSVVDARLTTIMAPGRRGMAVTEDGTELLVEPLPRVTEGAIVRLRIVREAIAEPGAVKRAKAVASDEDLCGGNDLGTRIGPHRVLRPHDADILERAGWSECLEAAARGIVAFDGGTLRISRTPAMTLIDVDGDGDPLVLATAGAAAAAAAIRRFGLAGNIGIDLPTVGGKPERTAIAEAFDAMMPQPFERTAVNGFGFLQVIRPRVRASLCEILASDPAAAEARALMRQVRRSGHIGALTLTPSAAVTHALAAHPAWLAQLGRELGGPVTIGP